MWGIFTGISGNFADIDIFVHLQKWNDWGKKNLILNQRGGHLQEMEGNLANHPC